MAAKLLYLRVNLQRCEWSAAAWALACLQFEPFGSKVHRESVYRRELGASQPTYENEWSKFVAVAAGSRVLLQHATGHEKANRSAPTQQACTRTGTGHSFASLPSQQRPTGHQGPRCVHK
jgi:hypothetical protein